MVPVVPATQEAEAGNAWTQEAEVAVSWDLTTALQPGDRVRLCQKTKKTEPSYIVSGNVKMVQPLWKSLAAPQQVKHRITVWPSNSIPRYTLNWNRY